MTGSAESSRPQPRRASARGEPTTRSDKHGSHQYDGSEFGLTEPRLAERFSAYRERFRAYLN